MLCADIFSEMIKRRLKPTHLSLLPIKSKLFTTKNFYIHAHIHMQNVNIIELRKANVQHGTTRSITLHLICVPMRPMAHILQIDIFEHLRAPKTNTKTKTIEGKINEIHNSSRHTIHVCYG